MNMPMQFSNVNFGDESQLGVNARDVHRGLESKKKFTDWIKARIAKYGFIEGVDYLIHQVVNQVPHQGGFRAVTTLEYVVSIDMAKELSMVECTEVGRKVRLYFIEHEKQSRNMNQSLQIEIGRFMQQVEQFKNSLSEAGRFLCVGGKQIMPKMLNELDGMVQKAQHTLPFEE